MWRIGLTVRNATINDLVESNVNRVFTISVELQAKQKGQCVFEKMGKASLAFVREYPVLFPIQPNRYMVSYENVENELLETLAEDEALKGWILCHGENGHVPSWISNKEFDVLLMEMGDDVLLAQQMRQKDNSNEKDSYYGVGVKGLSAGIFVQEMILTALFWRK